MQDRYQYLSPKFEIVIPDSVVE